MPVFWWGNFSIMLSYAVVCEAVNVGQWVENARHSMLCHSTLFGTQHVSDVLGRLFSYKTRAVIRAKLAVQLINYTQEYTSCTKIIDFCVLAYSSFSIGLLSTYYPFSVLLLVLAMWFGIKVDWTFERCRTCTEKKSFEKLENHSLKTTAEIHWCLITGFCLCRFLFFYYF